MSPLAPHKGKDRAGSTCRPWVKTSMCSTKLTVVLYIRQRSPRVFRSKVVWFKENRLIRWGLTVPAECTFNLYRDTSPLILRM
ncbi:unnamed protein product [Brassica oleracea var. botrytis]